jgi:hypothetical protein
MVWVIGIGLALFLVFALPRQMLAVIGMLVMGVGGLFAWLEYTDYRQTRDRDSVVLVATFEPESCAPDYPIRVKISNTNTKTLLAVSFGLAGFLQDQRDPVYQGLAMASNRVIAPGESHEACWAVPRMNEATAPALLSWKATVSYPTFGTPPLAR